MILAPSFVVACGFLILAYGAASTARQHAGVIHLALAAALLAVVVILMAAWPDFALTRVLLLAAVVGLMCSGARKLLASVPPIRAETAAVAVDPAIPAAEIAARATAMARSLVEPSWRGPLWETPGILLLLLGKDGKIRRADGGLARRFWKKPSEAVGVPAADLAMGIEANLTAAVSGRSLSWLSGTAAYRIAPAYDTAGEVDGAIAVVVEY